jgi:hypothetical protein
MCSGRGETYPAELGSAYDGAFGMVLHDEYPEYPE